MLLAMLLALFNLSTFVKADDVEDVINEDTIEEEDLEDDDGEPIHPLTDLLSASPDVHAAYAFPDEMNAGNKMVIGKENTIVCGLVNKGDKAINVTMVFGSLNSPFDFRFHIQNFTGREYYRSIEAGQEASFEYNFVPHASLDPIDFQVAITIFYEDEDEGFTSTFYNETVTLVEASSDFDMQTFFTYFLAFAVTGLVLGFLYTMQNKGSSGRKEFGTQGVNSDWISTGKKKK
jgi:translocon-associated protein subunit alpha